VTGSFPAADHGSPAVTDVPRSISAPISPADRVFRGVLRASGIAVLVITGLIALFLVLRGASALKLAGLSFFTSKTWIPAANRFGIASLLPNGPRPSSCPSTLRGGSGRH